MSSTPQPWNRNCSQCLHMPNCHSWVALTAARECPAYDDGTTAEAERAREEIRAFIAGSDQVKQQPP
ncbi:MAG TPA: hypothetical protein PLE99_06000 [Candidatus Thiothrix moscowensis]|uniref:hypothetical protein n=1 Tax=unclassified Thiothrix TaxID=2636184 RepID=UPI0025FDE3D6|nr:MULTISPECIES: hypothetical protein [unclassified Thiothrix]HRJ52298.1 hypothetical protein [Candidatus Thiothrix moscowensis]HRJ92613.1 hypothetical protein [Candidatus Thiothrix moscowensis]